MSGCARGTRARPPGRRRGRRGSARGSRPGRSAASAARARRSRRSGCARRPAARSRSSSRSVASGVGDQRQGRARVAGEGRRQAPLEVRGVDRRRAKSKPRVTVAGGWDRSGRRDQVRRTDRRRGSERASARAAAPVAAAASATEIGAARRRPRAARDAGRGGIEPGGERLGRVGILPAGCSDGDAPLPPSARTAARAAPAVSASRSSSAGESLLGRPAAARTSRARARNRVSSWAMRSAVATGRRASFDERRRRRRRSARRPGRRSLGGRSVIGSDGARRPDACTRIPRRGRPRRRRRYAPRSATAQPGPTALARSRTGRPSVRRTTSMTSSAYCRPRRARRRCGRSPGRGPRARGSRAHRRRRAAPRSAGGCRRSTPRARSSARCPRTWPSIRDRRRMSWALSLL